jgi:hypothetical protein
MSAAATVHENVDATAEPEQDYRRDLLGGR